MIEVKNTLNGKLNASIIKEYPELEEITITPTLEEQKFKPTQYGFSEVTVKAVQGISDNVRVEENTLIINEGNVEGSVLTL